MNKVTSDISIHDELEAAINNLYVVFAAYPLRPHIEGNTYDITPEDHERIRSKPLRELSSKDISLFASHAIHLWGEVDDLKHFLPRIFELVATDPDQWTYSAATAFGALHLANWTYWPVTEQDAIHAFFIELWRHVLLQMPSEYWADPRSGYLCAIGNAVDDLSPYLAMLEHNPSTTSLLRIAQMVDENAETMAREGKLAAAFWEQHEQQMQQVFVWFLKPEIEGILNKAFELYLAHKYRGEPAHSFEQLQELRKLRKSTH